MPWGIYGSASYAAVSSIRSFPFGIRGSSTSSRRIVAGGRNQLAARADAAQSFPTL